jgi:hypothetical protein
LTDAVHFFSSDSFRLRVRALLGARDCKLDALFSVSGVAPRGSMVAEIPPLRIPVFAARMGEKPGCFGWDDNKKFGLDRMVRTGKNPGENASPGAPARKMQMETSGTRGKCVRDDNEKRVGAWVTSERVDGNFFGDLGVYFIRAGD